MGVEETPGFLAIPAGMGRLAGRDGGGGRGEVYGGLGVGGGEGEEEVVGLQDVAAVGLVACGLVGFGDEGHAEAPGEAAPCVGGVAAEEFDVVEAMHSEAVGVGVVAHEVLAAHEREHRLRVDGHGKLRVP